MGIFRQFPYTNFHELNADWLIRIAKKLEKEWEDFKVDWDKDIQEQVYKWLDEHPEATTTVLDGAITTPKLKDGCVTSDKLEDGSVTSDKLEDGSVTSDKLQDDSITSDKLQDGCVTSDKLTEDLTSAIFDNTRFYKINDELTLTKKLIKNSSYDRNFIARKQRTSIVEDHTWGVQSAEYIDSLDHVILGFTKGDSTGSCILVEVTKDLSNVIKTSQVLSLGHCNDIAYNPDTNNIYVATMTTGSYARSIVEVNVNTLTITNVFNVNKPIYQLSYDRINKVFYAGSNENIIYDTEFNEISTSPLATIDQYIGETTTAQGSTVIDGNYILLKETDTHSYLITHNYNTGEIEQIQRYKNMMAGDEAEALFYIPNDGLYMVSGQLYISMYKFETKFTSSDDEMFDVFDAGIHLTNGTNLNDILQAGKYYTVDGNETDTLINIPQLMGSRGITVYVLTQAFNWIIQVAIGSGNLGNHNYWRMKSGAGTWTVWKPLQAEFITLNTNPISVGGTVQIPSDILNNFNEITITMHRGRYVGSVTIPTATITGDDARNGACIWATHSNYWEFGISTNGTITLNAMNGVSEPYVRILYR